MFLSEFGKCNILFKTCHSGFVFVFNPKSPCPAMNGIFKNGLPIKKKDSDICYYTWQIIFFRLYTIWITEKKKTNEFS